MIRPQEPEAGRWGSDHTMTVLLPAQGDNPRAERAMNVGGSSKQAETPEDLPNREGSHGPFRRVVRITNPLGLHHRAADYFSRAARRFSCRVTVHNGMLAADGKNIWDLLGLVVMPDQEVILETEGPDAAVALEHLAAILGAPNGEDYTI
ncbi:MAG: HPr family phosphocarrier protein [Gemmataceae bacterium]|nr:HPr family phosphocarrier protein [Gemmataceae bacterium]MCS7269699.1 HPr family phosphocarrier protein [Gemmataceae bacterium]MDW8241965.1 HPr family phosphocarrier protein [Thermogemmata sp.]